MAVKASISRLLSKEMDRKQFLAHVGAGLLALVGITSLLKALNGHSHQGRGYGSGSYGGKD